MPTIRSDERDEYKRQIGIKLKELKKNDPQELQKILSHMTDEQAEEILYDQEIWLRDNQWVDLASPSPIHLLLAGRGFGKGFAGASTVKRAVENHGVKDILIIAVASRDFRATIAPAILDSYSPNDKNKPTHSVGKGGIFWPNGAVATCIPAEAGEDAVRGLNSELIWCDEPAFYGNNEGIIDQALLTLRREPSILIATTSPKATPKIIEWVERGEDPEDHMVKLYSGSTYENMENLSNAFIDTVIKKYEGTRMGDTELEGKLILTNDSALWQTYVVKRNTIDPEDLPPMREISIGIDPAMLNKKGAGKNARTPDSTGITVSGCDDNGTIYTLEGHTGSYSAEQWVDKVCMLHDKYAPKVNKIHIVAEINVIGEEMLRMSFNKAGRKDVEKRISAVFATQSKIQRAMPYALLTEQDKVKFVDGEYLKLLSMEMTTYDGTGKSPNALDSAVWSWSKLQPNKKTYVQSKEILF